MKHTKKESKQRLIPTILIKLHKHLFPDYTAEEETF
jgi:hypothetical protein